MNPGKIESAWIRPFSRILIKLGFTTILSTAGLFAVAQSLKLITYNIRLSLDSDGENAWTHRKSFLAEQLRFYGPDIFGIQEALPEQVAYLSERLSEYAVIGIGREGPGKGESSNIFYRKDRVELQSSGTFWLSETPEQVSKGWDAAYNRVCTYGLFRDRKTRKYFWVFNTHLDHMGELARTKGIELILSKMATLNTKKFPAFFMGDFNSEPATERIRTLKKTMKDSREISGEPAFGPSGTFNGFRHDVPVTTLIDYIFVSADEHVRVKKYAVLSDSKNLRYPSDHLPVFVEVEIH